MKARVKGLVVAGLAAPGWHSAASAAQVNWGPVTSITSVADLNQTGTFVAGVNTGVTTPGSFAISGTDITFQNGGLTDRVVGFVTNTGPGGNFYVPTTGNANLDTVLDSHSYIAMGNPNGRGVVALTNLVVGQQYLLQVIAVADDRACCATRTQTVDDGLGNVSGAMQRGLAQSVTGTFTADATTQSFFIAGVNDPGLSAYQLRAVPEPACLALFALAGWALHVRRKRD